MTQENERESSRSSIEVSTTAIGEHTMRVKIYVDGERITDEVQANEILQQTLANVKAGIESRGGVMAKPKPPKEPKQPKAKAGIVERGGVVAGA